MLFTSRKQPFAKYNVEKTPCIETRFQSSNTFLNQSAALQKVPQISADK